jgi:signal transduction histidine kinase/CheY-like chemotaxis protein
MSLEQAFIVVVNWLALSIATGLIFVMLIQPQRTASNWWFSLMLIALDVWAYFAMARSIPDLNPFGETANFYLLFTGLSLIPIAFYGYVVHVTQQGDSVALGLRAWGLVFMAALVILLWTDQLVAYTETGGERVELSFEPLGVIALVHFGVYLVMSALYLHISKNDDVKPLLVPAALLMFGYASNIFPALRLPPLGIGLATAAVLLIGHRLVHWQVFNPLRTKDDEIRVANNDLRQMSNDLSAARAAVDRLEDELGDAIRAKAEFLTTMSHQLRTPLNSIVGYAELMGKGVYGDLTAQQRDRVEKIHRNGIALLNVIQDILDLSRVEGGRLELNLSTVRVGALAQSVIEHIQPDADAKGLDLQAETDRPLRLIHADEMRVRQVLLNLLTNAVTYTPTGFVKLHAHNVTVREGRSDDFALPVVGWLSDRDWMVISVEDSGVGIPPEKQAVIFEEYQYGAEQSGQDGNRGLGLAVASKLVELHAGRIWVRSREGAGSTFYIALPAQADYELYEGDTEMNVQLEDVRAILLLVTNSDETATYLMHTLQREQFRVSRAEDGPAAVARAHEVHPAAILVDVLMPDLAAWDAVRRLRDDPGTTAIPIILASLHEQQPRAMALGACAVVAKPVQRDQLLAALARIQDRQIDQPVLIVDDDPAERAMLAQFLAGEDFPVQSYAAGGRALAWLRGTDDRGQQHVAGLVLLDLIMPGVSGFEILYDLRRSPQLLRVPVVLLYPDPDRLSAADAAALPGYVQRVMTGRGDEEMGLIACVEQTLE